MDWSKVRLSDKKNSQIARVTVGKRTDAMLRIISAVEGVSISRILLPSVEQRTLEQWQAIEPQLVAIAESKGLSVEQVSQHLIDGGNLNTL